MATPAIGFRELFVAAAVTTERRPGTEMLPGVKILGNIWEL